MTILNLSALPVELQAVHTATLECISQLDRLFRWWRVSAFQHVNAAARNLREALIPVEMELPRAIDLDEARNWHLFVWQQCQYATGVFAMSLARHIGNQGLSFDSVFGKSRIALITRLEDEVITAASTWNKEATTMQAAAIAPKPIEAGRTDIDPRDVAIGRKKWWVREYERIMSIGNPDETKRVYVVISHLWNDLDEKCRQAIDPVNPQRLNTKNTTSGSKAVSNAIREAINAKLCKDYVRHKQNS